MAQTSLLAKRKTSPTKSTSLREAVEVNTRGNETKTGLPLADTHYAVKGEDKACFVYVYEVPTVMMLVRLPEDYAAALLKKHSGVKRSAFPKAKFAWYSVILDDTFSRTTRSTRS